MLGLETPYIAEQMTVWRRAGRCQGDPAMHSSRRQRPEARGT